MPYLTPEQHAKLIKICNDGMVESAKALTGLLNTSIDITVPDVSLLDQNEIYRRNLFSPDQLVSYVYEDMTGDFAGQTFLIFQRGYVSLLTHAVIGDLPQLSEQEFRVCEQEAMLEIGNIIISSCIGMLMNRLSCSSSFSLPKYREDNIDRLFKMQLNENNTAESEIILLEAKLQMQSHDIPTKLLLILSLSSITCLFEKLNNKLNERKNHETTRIV